MSSELAGKVAFVTGAARGIGAATAKALAQRGASVAIGARRAKDAQPVADEITQAGGKAIALACDVTDRAMVGSAVSRLTKELGAPDILISNAGVIQPIAMLADADPTEWMQAVEVNLVGAFHCLQAVLPPMVERGSGVVVHLSSGAAHNPLEGWSAYCASKAGLAMLTRSVHLEYAPQGIRVYGFSPGVVDTGMQAEIRTSGINRVSKLKREELASVDEPAAAIAWLCGPEGSAYDGQEVDIRNPDLCKACGLEVV